MSAFWCYDSTFISLGISCSILAMGQQLKKSSQGTTKEMRRTAMHAALSCCWHHGAREDPACPAGSESICPFSFVTVSESEWKQRQACKADRNRKCLISPGQAHSGEPMSWAVGRLNPKASDLACSLKTRFLKASGHFLDCMSLMTRKTSLFLVSSLCLCLQ